MHAKPPPLAPRRCDHDCADLLRFRAGMAGYARLRLSPSNLWSGRICVQQWKNPAWLSNVRDSAAGGIIRLARRLKSQRHMECKFSRLHVPACFAKRKTPDFSSSPHIPPHLLPQNQSHRTRPTLAATRLRLPPTPRRAYDGIAAVKAVGLHRS